MARGWGEDFNVWHAGEFVGHWVDLQQTPVQIRFFPNGCVTKPQRLNGVSIAAGRGIAALAECMAHASEDESLSPRVLYALFATTANRQYPHFPFLILISVGEKTSSFL